MAEAEGAFIQHADSFQAVFSQIQATLKFFFQLVRTKNQMAFGNSELTHTNQTVHFAAVLVTEQSRGFAQAHRQLTIGTLTVQENLILERAGHRTQSEAFFSFVMRVAQDEHAVKIMIPVTGNTIQITFCHQRSFGQQIAAFLFYILNPTLQQLDYTCTFRQQDRQTLADIINSSEVFQIAAQFVMVTLQGFSLLCQICVQLFLLRESDTIDTLQHLAVGISTPVSTGSRGQFNSVSFNTASRIKMRTSAQISEIALFVEADNRILRQVVNQFNFIRFFFFFHEFYSLCTRQLKAL